MTLPVLPKCLGKYDNAHGEFGKVIRRECIGCLRRTPGSPDRQAYIAPPEFEMNCPERIENEV